MIIDGKQIADEILGQLKKDIETKKLNLQLGAVLVGDDPEFKKFVELKGKAAESLGIGFTIYKFAENIEMEELKKNMHEISEWSDGVLVELPLPKHIDQEALLSEIPIDKDVDVLSEKAQELFYSNQSKIMPPAAEALLMVLTKYGVSLKNKKAVVFGQGLLVGKPVAHFLEREGAEVFRIRSKTENPTKLPKKADIVIVGVGKSGLVTGDMVKYGAVVVDFGYGKSSEGKMVGDVDFKSVSPKASLITPVPGGMGPILIVTVLKNLIKLKTGYDIS